MAVAIFHQAIIASVAIRKASMMVPESHMIIFLLISARVSQNVTGIITERSIRINWLFSIAAGLLSVNMSLKASHAIIRNVIFVKLCYWDDKSE